MGKASRGKRQKESHDKPLLKNKLPEAEKITSKWSLFNKPIVHFFLIAIVGLLIYSNTFNVPFHFDDIGNIVGNYKLQSIQNFWPPSGTRWLGYLTFALNYHFGGLNVTGYHIVNLTSHILNAILVYWLVVLTFKTPYFIMRSSESGFRNSENDIPHSAFHIPHFTFRISIHLFTHSPIYPCLSPCFLSPIQSRLRQ